MMYSFATLLILILVVTVLTGITTNTVVVLALTLQQPPQPPVQQQQPCRRTFLSRATSSFIGAVVGTTTTTYSSTANAAELDDLAMPTAAADQQNDADAIMAERVRRKVELQKAKAQPKTFTESFQKERSKQQSLNGQTKAERRNAMCEELGRGC